MNKELFAALLTRRSLKPKYLTAPAPTAEELALCARAALRAPVHGGDFPCRFVLVPEERRGELSELMRRASALAGGDEAAQERAASKAFKGPQIVAFVVDETAGETSEALLSAGAALDQFLLALQAMGYRAITLSGKVLKSEELQKAFCTKPGERLAGWLSVGTPAEGVEFEAETRDGPLSGWA